MKSIIIPLEFLQAIGEKPHLYRIYWVKFLADYHDYLFKPDFVDYFHNDMKGKDISLNLETINEVYDFGRVFFKDGLLYHEEKKGKEKVYTEEHRELAQRVINYLNEKSFATFTDSKANLDCIVARIKEGFSLNDFKRVIDKKCQQWMNTEQQKYLRPITLFQAKKFENYLNEPETITHEPKSKQSSIDKLSNASNRAKEYASKLLSNQR